MGKGQKICKICGSVEGPRAFNCKNGHGFKVKGIQQPDIAVGTTKQITKLVLLDKTKRSLAKYIVKLHDSIIVKDECKKAWKSLHSTFHIEYRPKFDGIDMGAYGHYVLVGSGGKVWERFPSLKKAVHEMVKKEKKIGLHIRQKP